MEVETLQPLGQLGGGLRKLDWVFNIFAIPDGERFPRRWRSVLAIPRCNVDDRGWRTTAIGQ
jgi:hypothetical protein